MSYILVYAAAVYKDVGKIVTIAVPSKHLKALLDAEIVKASKGPWTIYCASSAQDVLLTPGSFVEA